MGSGILFAFICVVSLFKFAESGTETWKWKYNETVCYNQGENATLTWRVQLNSAPVPAESVANVEIWQVIPDAGGATSKMFSKVDGPDAAFNDRIMSVTVLTVTNTPPVFDVIFTLANLSNSIDGYGTQNIQCRVTSSKFRTGQPAKDTLLKIQVPIHNFIGPSNTTVSELDSVNLTCSADGSPTPTFRWTNPEREVVGQGSSYSPAVYRNMSGEYTCIATDGCGGNYSRSATVTVQYKPENTNISSSNTSVCQNDSVTLTCSATADPPVSSYTFYNNGSILVLQSSGTYVLPATIPGVNIITCEPNNTAGRGANATIQITVNVPISTFTINPTRVTVNESDSLNLTCTTDGIPPPNITWTNSKGQTVGHGSTYRLTNINRNMTGVYTCTAVDGCGGTYKKTVTLTVQYKPENTKLSSSNTSVCQNDSVTLTCSATADPPVSSYTFYNNSGILVSQSSATYVLNATIPGVNTITCEPSNAAGRGTTSSTIVTVNVPISKITIDPTSVTVNELYSATLTCTADGFPPPNVTWTNPMGVAAVGHGPTYRLTNITRDMTGVYTCTAVDECGGTYNKTATLTVQYVSFRKEDKCSYYTSVDITVESKPNASVSCSTDQQKLDLTVKGTSQDTTVYSVALPKTSSYVRNFTCTANNSANITTHTFHVYKFGSTVVKSGRFVVKNTTCPPSNEDTVKIYNMVNESLGASCLKDLNITFKCGSLIVLLTLTMTADIPDPFISLREALIQNAAKYGFTIDPSSVKMDPEETTAPPTSATVTQHITTAVPAGGLTDVTIALIVVGCVVFLLILFGVIFLVCKKKKRKRRDSHLEMHSHGALNGSPYAEVGPTAHNNGGTAEGGYAAVVHNPTRDNSPDPDGTAQYAQVDKSKKSKKSKDKAKKGKLVEATQGGAVPVVTYAEVDKSKKMKIRKQEEPTYAEVDRSQKTHKKKPGELLYAELGDFQDGKPKDEKPKDEGGLEFDSGQNVKMPQKYEETQYAEITQFRKGDDVKGSEPVAGQHQTCFPPGPPILTPKNVVIQDTSIKMSWASPLDNGGNPIIDYKVEADNFFSHEKIASNCIVIPDLKPNTKYVIKVSARNDAGYGSAATEAVTTRQTGKDTDNGAYANAAYDPGPEAPVTSQGENSKSEEPHTFL